jgi:hypothetical protein
MADILVELTSRLSATELGMGRRFGPFFGKPQNPVARVALHWEVSDQPAIPRGELIFDRAPVWKMYRKGFECYVAFTSRRTAQPICVLRANATWDDVTVAEQRMRANWERSPLIGWILRTTILLTGGLFFHAAAIDDNGYGIVIAGHSGEGKSTQASFWNHVPGAVVINEDQAAVRSNATGTMCYGTPWAGKSGIGHNHQAPLAVLILLEQAPESAIQPVSPAAAAPLLAARAFLPYWDRALMQRAMVNLNAILARVPVYRLRCRPEPEVVSLVRSVL